MIRSESEGVSASELFSLVGQISKDICAYPARYRASIYIILDISSSIILRHAAAAEEKRRMKDFFVPHQRRAHSTH